MSDLTADEALRAAEWFDTQYWTDAAMRLRGYAAELDPPETVESLRAEQDKVVAQFEMVLLERNKAREDVEYWQEQHLLVCDESACRLGDRNVEREKLERAECVITSHITALKAVRSEREGLWREVEQRNDDLHKANAEIYRLRAAFPVAEAAWERCKREPRMWYKGEPEPEKVQRVRDRDGDEWVSYDRRWCCTTVGAGGKRAWRSILNYNGPLTEVLDED